ncbi:hypothetical protein J9317_04415 [Metabacillus sp. KIGAM252]|uniref:Lipoprotein n=1 Tax=Metabacillus flavus TaxID=2823519 RepID=A0ABS5LBL3_9BACI|nr:hypothetical protein [Metabacillus flavus]MBS2968001.1 hypothetical protein [Metabacillus flavus]
MKRPYILSTALVLSLTAGCSQTNAVDQGTSSKSPKQKSSPETAQASEVSPGFAEGEPAPGPEPSSAPSSPEQVINETSKLLKTRVPFTLPKTMPVSKGLHLTSKIKSDANSYEITFYQTEKPIPINNSKLNTLSSDSKIATIKATEYKTEQEAADRVSYQKAASTGNPPIDLGHGIKGYSDAGAGSIFLHWNEGRWSFISKALNKPEKDSNKELAVKVVNFLEKQMLPPPDKGAVLLDGNNPYSRNNLVVWQDGNIVYEIEQANGAMTALEIAVAYNKD